MMATKANTAPREWPEGLPPLFYVNSTAPADRMRLSLAHELGHIVMHRSASDTMEAEADRFAAELLMPAKDIRPHLSQMSFKRAAHLKPYWRTSMASLIRRARDLGKLDQAIYSRMFRRFSQLGYRKNEPVKIPEEKALLIHKVVDVFASSNRYSQEDLARFLCVHLDELPASHPGTSGLRLVS